MENQYAKQRMIKDIQMDDVEIQVTGYVREQSPEDNKIIIDDKTGTLTVDIGEIEDVKLNEDDLINVIGEIKMNMDGEQTLNAQIIQDMKDLNFEYYTQLYKIKKDLISK
jgi:hypothetical protein